MIRRHRRGRRDASSRSSPGGSATARSGHSSPRGVSFAVGPLAAAAGVVHLFAWLGRREPATSPQARPSIGVLPFVDPSRGSRSACRIAQARAWRGERDGAFAWPDRAVRRRDAGLSELEVDCSSTRSAATRGSATSSGG
ncbi:MAG TPA: hypothetical protein VMT17_09670 [Anaeromyxobacteraceae bacterium]|nr:hypothetical protein [Anaeromyxobacteraceae bacterium]